MSHAVVMVALGKKVKVEGLEAAVARQMKPFDENGRWFGKGSRWDWYEIGGRWSGLFGGGKDYLRLKEFDREAWRAKKQGDAAEAYDFYVSKPSYPFSDVNPGETRDDYVARKIAGCGDFPSTRAFLRDRQWHEGERLGWFGTSTASECEIAGKKTRRCLTRVGATARIVTWKEPSEAWQPKFFDRFIKPLDPESWLVAVDYHV